MCHFAFPKKMEFMRTQLTRRRFTCAKAKRQPKSCVHGVWCLTRWSRFVITLKIWNLFGLILRRVLVEKVSPKRWLGASLYQVTLASLLGDWKRMRSIKIERLLWTNRNPIKYSLSTFSKAIMQHQKLAEKMKQWIRIKNRVMLKNHILQSQKNYFRFIRRTQQIILCFKISQAVLLRTWTKP